MPGLSTRTDSKSRPNLAMPPGLRFSIMTSARRASSRARARSSSAAQVEHDRALPAVDAEVVRRDAVALGRRPGAGLVAARRALDLDHLGAQVGEQHRGVGAGQHPGEVGDQQAVERSGHGADLLSMTVMRTSVRCDHRTTWGRVRNRAKSAPISPAARSRSGRWCSVSCSTVVSAAWRVDVDRGDHPLAVADRRGHRPDAQGELLVGQRPAAGVHLAQLGVALLLRRAATAG